MRDSGTFLRPVGAAVARSAAVAIDIRDEGLCRRN
jgi:hypothetical protein